MTGLSAVAPDLFALLLGEKWMPTVPYFEAMCLVGLFTPLAMIAYNVLKTLSDGRVVVRLEVVKRVLMTGVLAVTIPHSVMAIVWGMVAMAAIELVLNLVATTRLCTLSLWRFVRTLLPIAAVTALMYGTVVWGRATPYCRPAPRLAAYGAADRRRRGLRRCRGPFPAGIPARDAGDRTEVMAQNLLM